MTRQEARERVVGPVASVATPFCQGGSVDEHGLRRFIDFTIDGGASTIMLTYGDSLCTLLTDDEIARITAICAEHTAGRAVVVAADRGWGLNKEVEYAKCCAEVGADLLMVLPPDWAGSCTQDTLVAYYAAVAEEIPVMIVTNIFARRGDAFAMETLARVLAEVPGVVAVKDGLCGPFARKLGLLAADEWSLMAGGQKQNHLNMLPYGCHAYLSTFIKFAPQVTRDYWAAIQRDDIPATTGIIAQYDIALFDFLMTLTGGFDAGVHGAMELFGVTQRWRRAPYHSLTDDEMDHLAGFFQGLGLLT